MLLKGRLHPDEHEPTGLLHLRRQLGRRLPRDPRPHLGHVLVRLAKPPRLEDLADLAVRDEARVGDALLVELLHDEVDDVLVHLEGFLCLHLLQPLVEVVDACGHGRGCER